MEEEVGFAFALDKSEAFFRVIHLDRSYLPVYRSHAFLLLRGIEIGATFANVNERDIIPQLYLIVNTMGLLKLITKSEKGKVTTKKVKS